MVRRKTLRLVAACVLLYAGAAQALEPDRGFFQYEGAPPPESINLPSEIVDVDQDAFGFLWLATASGLIKYNGLDATTIRVSSHPGLLSNVPTKLFVDSANRLFVSSERGTVVYDGISFVTLLSGAKGGAQAQAFAEDAAGTVWIGTDEGLWQYIDNQLLPADIDYTPGHIRSVLWHGGKLYIGSRGRVSVLDGSSMSEIELPARFSDAFVRDLEFHQGRVWGATRTGLFNLDGSRVVDAEELVGKSIDVLLSDRDGSLWFGGQRIIGRFLPDGRLESPHVGDNTLGFAPEITDLFEDSLGQHWHASRFFGLMMLRDTPVVRTSYSEGMPSTNVTAVAADSHGKAFVAMDAGVSALSGGQIIPVIDAESLQGQTIRSMTVDVDGRLWLGTEHGLRAFDVDAGSWIDDAMQRDIDVPVNASVAGVNGELWIGTDAGLYRVNEGGIRAYPDTQTLAIESLLFDSQGNLWLGSSNGIARFSDGKLTKHAVESQEPVGTVIGITELASGQIAAATVDRGILLNSGDRWVRYGEENNLPPEQIIDIESRGKFVWIVTSAGIFRTVLPDTTSNASDQLELQAVAGSPQYRSAHTTNCCRGRNSSSAVLAQSHLLVATDDGVISLDTALPVNKEATPQPFIKTVANAGMAHSVDSLTDFTLDPNDDSVRIDYSAVQLVQGAQVEFRYRLNGLSEKWVLAGNVRSAHFLNLPPGEFVFELQASLQPGVWSSNTASVAFKRSPVFVETAAFRALLWTVAVAAGLLLIWLWLKIARYRHQRIETRIAERTAELDQLNSKLRSTNEDLRHLNQTDPLTGLVNRRFFTATRPGSKFQRRAPESGLLLMIDIDFFKRVNDAYGHSAGDEVLCQFANLLVSATRQSDLAARWGGEEFMLICHCPYADTAEMMNRICASVRDHSFKLSTGHRLELTCSIGGIRYPLEQGMPIAEQLPTLLEIADAALYAVKMNGRDGWGLMEKGSEPLTAGVELANLALHTAQKLQELVDEDHLVWRTSRDDISLTMADTVMRLQALRAAKQ